MTERLLTAREVADLLGVTTETVLAGRAAASCPRSGCPAARSASAKTSSSAWLEERATPRRGVLTTTPGAARPLPAIRSTSALTTTEDEEDSMPADPTRPRRTGSRRGRWGLRYYDRDGKRRRTEPFPTKSAALAHYRDVIEPQLRGEPAPRPS